MIPAVGRDTVDYSRNSITDIGFKSSGRATQPIQYDCTVSPGINAGYRYFVNFLNMMKQFGEQVGTTQFQTRNGQPFDWRDLRL